jgi:transcriptional regulator with XRE-family HTH domain
MIVSEVFVSDISPFNASVKSHQANFNAKAHFSSRLAQAVEKDGRSKTAISQAMGAQPSALSRWLSGVIPDSENLTKLASCLGVSVQWLLTDEPSSNEPMREEVTAYHFTPRGGAGGTSRVVSSAEWLHACHLLLDHFENIKSADALEFAMESFQDVLGKYKAAKASEL